MIPLTKYAYDNISAVISRGIRNNRISINRKTLLEESDTCFPYGEAYQYHPTSPSGTKPTPPELAEKHREISIPQPFVCELTNVTICGPRAISMTEEGKYILEDSDGSSELLTDAFFESLLGGSLPIRKLGTGRKKELEPIISLVGPWSDEYYHWFTDYLPRLQGLKIYEKNTSASVNVLIHHNAPEWMTTSLEYLGINKDDCIPWRNGRLFCRNYVVSSVPRFVESDKPSYGYSPSPRAVSWVSKTIKSNVQIDTSSRNRILITRRGADTRRIQNESEVIDTLKEYNFTPVNLSNMSFETQLELFSQAEIVVAPHGAGLVNTIFSENAKILELFGNYVNSCYYTLSNGLEHTHKYVICDDCEGDLIVDPSSITTAIDEWI